MSHAERLKAAAERRAGHDVSVNGCPPDMAMTSGERHETATRSRVRHDRNQGVGHVPGTTVKSM